MSTNSKKHHYLPQFYLRGFTDEKGFFTVYDKKLDIFRRSRPENNFYEKNKNLIDIHGEKSLFIENMYSHLESTLAPVVALIENSSHKDRILSSDIIVRLKFFVEIMRWRNPALDDVYKTIVRRMKIEDFGLNVVSNNEEKSKEIEEIMMQEPVVWQMLRPFMAAMGLGSMTNESYDANKWNITYQEGGFPILGDFPIIFNPATIADNINGEFIFPLSSQRTVIYSKTNGLKQLPDMFSIDKDLAQIHLAKRFVCCKRGEYLKFMISLYKKDKHEFTDKFFENIFLAVNR
ncbi:DUF4238 domain-containing protein [Hymenobacter psychrophilus]|uniref:DUF4238 domain-containing protein n=1 Tax=Hymenobacter psychrophilus TaxID=651662 RepID=A0A1H3KHC7_9BACT|nr:DUF4238 domain-containing protein [Hymenobacter psychrophilus]SDY51516.1 Protein of unknown function [Hymenobacter psychrophilus]